ncbi:TNFAIP3-interacting protein 1, partial [Galemys pyrenaicus]
GRGPYRIYDPGGSAPPGEASAAFERLVEENSRLKEKMQGIKMLGERLGESQAEASRLRQKAEELVKDSKPLLPRSPSLSSFDQLAELTGTGWVPSAPRPRPGAEEAPQAASSEFEVVPTEEHASPPESGGPRGNTPEPGAPPPEHGDLRLHLQRLGSSLSECAEEPDRGQLFAHLGRMALEFNRLASQVQRNEQRTSLLQTLCEQLREENEALKAKLDKGLEQRDQAAERLREENMELKKLLSSGAGEGPSVWPGAARKAAAGQQQAAVTAAKAPETGAVGAAEKKVKLLEQQRSELLEVNKQWDQHFRSMKQQYEQKVTELRQKLAEQLKQVAELEAEQEQRQRDFDRKLLLAKSKIEMEEVSVPRPGPSCPRPAGCLAGLVWPSWRGPTDKEQLTVEAKELRQKVKHLQDQLSPLARQREYQDREIQRLNKALEEALSIQAPQPAPLTAFGSPEGAGGLRKQELVTQNELLKQQVKIFEEDFQRERSDRERMNEEKEDLRKQVEKLQAQLSLSSAQLKAFQEEEKAKEVLRLHRRKGKASADRYHGEPHLEHLCGACPCACPPVAAMAPPRGFDGWAQIRYPPPPVALEHLTPLPGSHLFHLVSPTCRQRHGP